MPLSPLENVSNTHFSVALCRASSEEGSPYEGAVEEPLQREASGDSTAEWAGLVRTISGLNDSGDDMAARVEQLKRVRPPIASSS